MPPKAKTNADEEIFDQTAAPPADEMAPYRDTDDQLAVTANREDRATADQLATADDPISQLERFHAADTQRAQTYDGTIGDSEVGDGDFFINMAKADEKLKPMAIGTRLVVSCTGAEAKISGSGNPMIAVRVKAERVVSTPDASTDTRAYKNRTVRDNLLFIPPNDETGYRGTIWRANAAMRAFGVEPDHGVYRKKSEFLAMLQRKAEELVGAVCEIEVGIDDGTKGGTQPPELDPATGEPYPPKNTIARYYAYKPTPVAVVADDSDLPF